MGTIPRIHWQTGKYKPLATSKSYKSWKDLNPSFQFEYYDDAMSSQFILDYLGPDMHALYESFPLGVMRGDLWRYAILYVHGGIYSDSDTTCLRPVEEWLPVRNYADEETTLDVETWGINSKDLVSVGVAYQDVTCADCNLLVGLEGSVVVSQGEWRRRTRWR